MKTFGGDGVGIGRNDGPSISRSLLRDSSFKIRSSKSETNQALKSETEKIETGSELVWNFMFFDHLDLFRISDFEFFF